jgi:hypothetical protein
MLFKGDRAAFVNGDFRGFMSLLSDNLIWLSRNVLVIDKTLNRDTLEYERLFPFIYDIFFDDEQFVLFG